MRETRQCILRWWQPHVFEYRFRALACFLARRAGVQADTLHDLFAHGLERIECRHRLLEDHADVVPAQGAHFPFAGCCDIETIEADRSGKVRTVRQELHDRERRQRLAGSGFAHHARDLATFDGKADIL